MPIHKLFGHPDAIQNDMTIECDLASARLKSRLHPGIKKSLEATAAEAAKDWILLLQLDSDEALGLEWADAGRLFFWIRKQDLAELRFENCRVILQSY